MILGFTGTRRGMTEAQKQTVIRVFALRKPSRVHHGACEGADRDLWKICRESGRYLLLPPIAQTFWPGDEEQHDWAIFSADDGDIVQPVSPYLRRNGSIVRQSDALLSTPKGMEVRRSGTWSTIRFARKLGKPILIVWPDGTTKKENERAGL